MDMKKLADDIASSGGAEDLSKAFGVDPDKAMKYMSTIRQLVFDNKKTFIGVMKKMTNIEDEGELAYIIAMSTWMTGYVSGHEEALDTVENRLKNKAGEEQEEEKPEKRKKRIRKKLVRK